MLLLAAAQGYLANTKKNIYIFSPNQPSLEKGKVFYTVLIFTNFHSSHWERESGGGGIKLKMADRKSCDLCPKTFAFSSSLYNHMQTHSGGKKYNCSQCNKSFGRAENFKRYSLIHTGEKPHKCTQCNFAARLPF